MHRKRTYRNGIDAGGLSSFEVTVKETNLFIHAPEKLENIARELILEHRGYLESYIEQNPGFAKELRPWPLAGPAPVIIKDMALAGQKAGVGPMAAVAGAIAEHVGLGLLEHADEVVVENGGDIFLKRCKSVTIGIFAGDSPLSMRMGLRLDPGACCPIAVCTSSGTVGHSLSMGRADAVCVVSESCSLADAAATSLGNHVASGADIQKAIDLGKRIRGIAGLVVIMGENIGAWGNLELVPL